MTGGQILAYIFASVLGVLTAVTVLAFAYAFLMALFT